MAWFKDITFETPIEDIKRQYVELVKLHHPDVGGTTEDMAAINAEYERLVKHHYNIHRGRDGQVYTDERQDAPDESASQFAGWITRVVGMGLTAEVCGRWVWIYGDTYQHKDELRAMGAGWSRNKRMWYLRPADQGHRHHRHAQDMEEIRAKYGSRVFEARDDQLARV